MSVRLGISWRPRCARRKRSNRYSESCGPGPASGWYWTVPPGDVEQLESLDRAVVEVDVRERRGPEVGLPAHRLVAVDRALPAGSERREAVVLRGDLDTAGGEVAHGMVGAAVAEGQLERLEAHRAAEQLVAEADPPHGLAPDDLADRVHDVGERGRVARAVGEEHRVGVGGEQLLRRAGARVQLDARAAFDELAHHRGLDPGVDDRDQRAVTAAVAAHGPRRDDAREVLAGHRAARPRSARARCPARSSPGRRRRASRRRRGCAARARACRCR